MALGDKLFLPLLGDNVRRVLNVGTGTGIWASNVGRRTLESKVVGTDISPTQPSWAPPNVRYIIDDCLREWTWPKNHFDFIHMRCLYGCILSFVNFYK